MAYFPFFVEMKGMRGLIAGGGTVALRKAEKLLPYGPVLTVTAPEICPELQAMPELRLRFEAAKPEMADDYDFVIAATDDPSLNHALSARCAERRIPVNVVDDRDYCSFLFPALIREGPLSVGISTAGASPAAAVWLRRQVEALLPEQIGQILFWLGEMRPVVCPLRPDEPERAEIYAELFRAALAKGAPLDEVETQKILQG